MKNKYVISIPKNVTAINITYAIFNIVFMRTYTCYIAKIVGF